MFSTMTKFESNKYAEVSEPSFFKKKEPTYLDASSVPDSFDWRDKGAVTPVRSKGNCGGSWFFTIP